MKLILTCAFLVTLLSTSCSKSEDPISIAPPKKTVNTPVGEDFGDLDEEELPTRPTDRDEEELPTRPADRDEEDEVSEEEINPTRIIPGEPCYKYMSDPVARPVANCSKINIGRLGDFPEIVKFGSICLLKSEYDNGITIFTAEGRFTQVDEDWNRIVYPIYGFKKTAIKDDRVSFNFKDDGFRTSVTYDIVKETLRVKQVTKTFKKKIRHFELGCTPVYNIR